MLFSILVLVVLFALVAVFGVRLARKKAVHIILAAGLKRQRQHSDGLRHVFFCFVDHYEPLWAGADDATGRRRVDDWLRHYPRVVDPFRDGGGRAPQHSFFFPEEEYRPEYLDMLAELCNKGYGDVEVHLHHDNDTSDALRNKLLGFTEVLHERHGFLQRNETTGLIEYGFIHGNWTLDDSGPDGRWCGVKDEITVLKDTGCYADFTFPSAPHPTQPPTVNQLYYCTDDPLRACSHYHGREVVYGSPGEGDLLMVTGPLAVNWRERRKVILPAIENSDVSGSYLPTPSRVDLWVRTAIAVRNWPSWIFVKVHTHGTQEKNTELLLGPQIAPMYERLLGRYNDGHNYVMHFVTARELVGCVKALERGDAEQIRHIEDFKYIS